MLSNCIVIEMPSRHLWKKEPSALGGIKTEKKNLRFQFEYPCRPGKQCLDFSMVHFFVLPRVQFLIFNSLTFKIQIMICTFCSRVCSDMRAGGPGVKLYMD